MSARDRILGELHRVVREDADAGTLEGELITAPADDDVPAEPEPQPELELTGGGPGKLRAPEKPGGIGRLGRPNRTTEAFRQRYDQLQRETGRDAMGTLFELLADQDARIRLASAMKLLEYRYNKPASPRPDDEGIGAGVDGSGQLRLTWGGEGRIDPSLREDAA